MMEVVGYTIAALLWFAWMLDISGRSEARDKLRDLSQMREVDRMADLCESLDLPLIEVDTLMAGQMIRLNEAVRRLGYLFAPDFLARMMVPLRWNW